MAGGCKKKGTGTSPDTDLAGITYVGSEPVPIFSQPLGRQIGALPADQRSRAAELVDTKYGATAWTENR